jgi:hypothetical protein
MKLGTNDIGSVYLGTNAISSIYLGTNLVWSGMDPDYKAILDYATTQGYTLPSASQQLLQEQLIIDLKSAGVWSKLDTFGVFATDGNSDFALIDWIRLSQYTAVNSPTFTSNGGFTGNGTSSYIDTNYNPSTSGVNYTLNDAGRFYWVDNRGTSVRWEGVLTATTNHSRNGNVANMNINAGTSTLSAAVNFAVDEFHSFCRTSITNVELFTNTNQFSRTQLSISIISENQVLFRSGTTYSNCRFRFYGMGASLVSENTDFYNALNTYLTSL